MRENDEFKKLDQEYRESLKKLTEAYNKHIKPYENISPLGKPKLMTKEDIEHFKIFDTIQKEWSKKYLRYKRYIKLK